MIFFDLHTLVCLLSVIWINILTIVLDTLLLDYLVTYLDYLRLIFVQFTTK